MALTQKQRSVLYDHFAPLVGEDTAEALMAEFPGREGDDLVTKDFLRAELASLQSRLLGSMIGIGGLMTAVIVAFG